MNPDGETMLTPSLSPPADAGGRGIELTEPQRPPAEATHDLETVALLGMPIHRISLAQCVDYVMQSLRIGRGGWVITPNLDILRRWHRDAGFRQVVGRATLSVADGVPLVWAAAVQGTPLPGRVNGTDLMTELAAAAAERNRSVYLLGGEPGSAEAAAAALRKRLPGLCVAGTYCPPMGFEDDEAQWRQIAQRLDRAEPDIVFVGLGCPKQDRVITRLRPLLPSAWWLGIGVSFSLIGGTIPRAPRWMQANGLEWLHRLGQEPARLANRYLVHGIPFGLRLLASAVAMRLCGAASSGGHRCTAAQGDD